MVECSQLEPHLSNSFSNILLANNTVCGVVGLGYIDWLGSGQDVSTGIRCTVSVLLVLLTAPSTGPCRIPTENTVEKCFGLQNIGPTKASNRSVPQV